MFAMVQANAFCFEQAGREYNVNPALLIAIAQVESSMRHDVLNESHFERTKTIDIGLMQINSGALKRLAKEGITKEMLLRDPCTNVRVGARILAEKFKKEGPGWEGVGAYNASCVQLKGEACRQARATYTNKVWKAMNGQLKLCTRRLVSGDTMQAGSRAASRGMASKLGSTTGKWAILIRPFWRIKMKRPN